MNAQSIGRLFIPVLVIVYCSYMIWEQMTGGYREETQYYAYFMGGAAITLAFVVIVRLLMHADPSDQLEDEEADVVEPKQYGIVALLVLGAAAAVMAMEPVGYLITFYIFLVFALWVLGVRTLLPLALIPLGTMAVVHFGLVKALGLPLPAGLLRGIL